MKKDIHFTGVSGSFRKESFKSYLLNILVILLPGGDTLRIFSMADLPLFNADLDFPASKESPVSVTAFRNKLSAADDLVVVSPEYNYSIPCGLKYIIDWASRGEDSPLSTKMSFGNESYTWFMGNSKGCKQAYYTIFQFVNMNPIFKPEVLVARQKKNLIPLINQKTNKLWI